ncbi:MAG: hypothetical protein LBR97_03100 [Dysgonamonadaceae bacterium]|nr:hypothetical protein [Dysgonamonadaceae bacterium]
MLTAQEANIYNRILKESLKADFMKITIPMENDSNFTNTQIYKDINEKNLYRMLYRHKIEFLLPKENFLQSEAKQPELSPYATMLFYTNSKNESPDRGKFNGNGTFSGEFATKGDVLLSRSAPIMVNVPALLFFVASRLISAKDTHVPKESKKDKTLRIITKDVYHIDE